jgi:hypothetical protein
VQCCCSWDCWYSRSQARFSVAKTARAKLGSRASECELAPVVRATSAIPVVMLGGVDPVRSGWVKSLSRPEGNLSCGGDTQRLCCFRRDARFAGHRVEIAEFAIRERLPTVTGLNLLVRDGLLMSYAHYSVEAFRRAGWYVDRLLKGTPVAELPIELMSRFSATPKPQDRKGPWPYGSANPPRPRRRGDRMRRRESDTAAHHLAQLRNNLLGFWLFLGIVVLLGSMPYLTADHFKGGRINHPSSKKSCCVTVFALSIPASRIV